MSWPDNKRAGVCLHVTSLPGRYGIGELGSDAKAFVERIAAMGISVWQFLPLGPTAYADSPYQPLSSFAGNPLLIDMHDLVQRNLLTRSDIAALTRLPTDHVDYGRLIALKPALLAKAAAAFQESASGQQRADYDAFITDNRRWLDDYALFRVLKTQHRERAWPYWDTSLAHRDRASLRSAARRFRREIEAVKTAQFLFSAQWQELQRHAATHGVTLFGDIPIYIAHDSADAWAHPELLSLDRDGQPRRVAGVPPDYFSDDGQLWGNPVYDWPLHEKNGFRWWIDRVSHTIDLMDLVRVDHFRGFEAFWSVAADASTARDGAWQPGPGHALFDALKAALGTLPIVAEDLGVITPAVTELRERHNIPGMVVLQFEAGSDEFSIDDIPSDSVCYTGTHDNDTTVGWFNGGRGDTRTADEVAQMQSAVLRNTGGTAETIHLDLIRLAFASEARIAMVPMQDYLGLGSEARMNIPGSEGGNWQWRLRDHQLTGAVAETTLHAVTEADRARSMKVSI